MKKCTLIMLAAAMSFAACQEVEAPLAEENVLSAVIEQDETTKTEMDENNNILWSANDQIIAFMKSSYGHKYQVKSSFIGKSYADFSRISSAGGDDLSAGNEWDHNVAYYPYSSSVECLKSGSNYTLDVVLPSEQTYASESFGNGSMVMVAVSEDRDIVFKNVLGGMKLQLRGTQKVKSITLEGKNNEKLSGAATVTAYTDETKPAITMASGASKSVTLNCGSGVQLNESKATEFIISLPPVLFSKGFTVTVTDAEGKTYTVETDKANTVLRSSILTMPAFKLGEAPESGSPENAVDMIIFDLSKLTVVPGTTHTLTVDFEPYDANDKTLVWNSSNPSVASVDASGEIKALADGTSTITAVAVGGATATCAVTVKSCVVPSVDYIADGVNYGKGIAIGDVVWAPVNCGYEAPTDTYKGYPYGKLYQWGRPYGQGYNSSEATYPVGDNLVKGPVMPSIGNAEENKDKFFYASERPYDWSKAKRDDLWNSGTETSPVKTNNDPCPLGWRVPTYAELSTLIKNSSSWVTVEGRKGRYLSGNYTHLPNAPQVFFPAAGDRHYDSGNAYDRDRFGCYWSSIPTYDEAYAIYIYSSGTEINGRERAAGYSVRCVADVTEINPNPRPDPVVLAAWDLSSEGMASYADTWGGVDPGTYDKNAGDGGKYIAANAGGKGMLTYVQLDKHEVDVNDKARRVCGSSSGEPYVEGQWVGDSWNLTAEATIPAGSIVGASFASRASGTGLKYWIVEYLDGDTWKPALPTQTVEVNGETITYNVEHMNTANFEINFVVSTTVDMSVFHIRETCLSNAQARAGDLLEAPNGGTMRLKGGELSPRIVMY